MKSDKIYQIIEHQAQLKCGEMWKVMSDKERNTVMLKVAITMIKDYFNGGEK